MALRRPRAMGYSSLPGRESSPATMEAAGIANAAITQTFGNRTAAGITGRAIQILVHQGQCTRYDIFESGPQRVTTQRRYPTVR